ncbi:uncharacterized protein LOC132041429 [Lycium ferocissimum]|uniref:uncharacterized protein LOC132041429 n=1 Tax=Lycium ferocissimum TaxID=112874 RepID=UPI00281511F1|nr:uncharacterized protein LOC132041429 [Lycium ferocissimum]
MARRPRKQKSVEHPKKAKVEENYHQEPRHPVTLGEFLPSWFRNKTARDNIEASCFNTDKDEANDESLSTLSLSSSEKPIESSSKEVHTCDTRITFTDNDFLLGETPHNRPLYMVGYALEKRINIILINDGSGVNILPIRTMKELGITTEELSESRLMIQGFNQGGQRAIGAIKVDITIKDLPSSVWMHVIDAKTSYNMLLGKPWIHENKVVPSSYYQCLKYLEGSVKKKIVVDDKLFTEAESHFVDAKFYLKNYIMREVKVDDIATTDREKVATKRADETIGKAGVDAEVPHPSFDPNAYKLFVKAGHNPNEPSKLGKIPSAAIMMQSHKGLGYKQPPPVCISIRRTSTNHITVEDESVASNKRPLVFDRLGKSTTKASMFERLRPLKLKKKRKNKFHKDYQSVKMLALPRTQKDIQSLIPSRMRRQTNLIVSCGEVLKEKSHTVVYTKERDEDEESVGSSYHITIQSDQDTSFQMEVAEKLEDISACYHISFNDSDSQENEDARDAPSELEEGVKTTVDSLKEVNLGTDEDPRPTYLSAFLTANEEDTYIEILKEYRDVFA